LSSIRPFTPTSQERLRAANWTNAHGNRSFEFLYALKLRSFAIKWFVRFFPRLSNDTL